MASKLMGLRLFGMSYDSGAIQYNGPSSEGVTPSLPVNLYNHIASLQVSNVAMHLAS